MGRIDLKNITPTCNCPKCGHEEEDFDGFGFIGKCNVCGYCNHPSSSVEDGKEICDYCGQELAKK